MKLLIIYVLLFIKNTVKDVYTIQLDKEMGFFNDTLNIFYGYMVSDIGKGPLG